MFIEQYQTDLCLRDRLLHRFKQQIQYIDDWKAHLLRTIHQDQARVDILDNLDHETAMIQVDWAMKWLPTKYRESTVSLLHEHTSHDKTCLHFLEGSFRQERFILARCLRDS
jgi:hypothetical protein